MITIYGSAMCPDCQNCKYNFDKYGVEYKFLDVHTNLQYLKEFLYQISYGTYPTILRISSNIGFISLC